MLDNEQASRTAEAVLQAALAEQAAQTAKHARRKAFGGKWTGVGALVGLATGSLVAYFVTGHTFPWSIVGISFGGALGGFIDQRIRAAGNRRSGA